MEKEKKNLKSDAIVLVILFSLSYAGNIMAFIDGMVDFNMINTLIMLANTALEAGAIWLLVSCSNGRKEAGIIGTILGACFALYAASYFINFDMSTIFNIIIDGLVALVLLLHSIKYLKCYGK